MINRFICAEFPRPKNDPDGLLTDIVKRMMVHGPCGQHNRQSPCMVAKGPGHPLTYSKRFPKRFSPVTVVHEDGYPEYRRRDDLRSISVPLPGYAG